MSIYAKRLTGRCRAWAINFEDVTGFEPMYQDEYQSQEISFAEFKSKNLRWLENHQIDVFQSAERFPS